jgi:hypothetical protein
MPEYPQKPKMEFEVNIPATVRLIKMFKEGESEYGPWFGWNIEHDGVEKTLFANEQLQKELDGRKGSVQITKKQTKNSTGEGYHNSWIVREALLDEGGRVVPPPPPDVARDPSAYADFRKQRTEKLTDALVDVAIGVAEARKFYGLPDFTAEDYRAMAISLMISFDRKTQ